MLLWNQDDDTLVFFKELPQYYYAIVVILSQLSSILSILGSTLILCLILLEGQWRTSIIERYLCGLSTADFLASWGMLLQPHLLPVWTELRFSRGNLMTCRVAGAVNLAMIISFLYSCCLVTHFLRTLGKPSQQHRWGVGESIVHGALWTVPLLYIVSTVTLGLVHPSPFYGACVVLNPAAIGNYANVAGDAVLAIIAVVFPMLLVYGLICGVLLYCKVRKLVRIMEATTTSSASNGNEEDDAMDNEDDPSSIEDAMLSYDGLLSSSSSEEATPSNPTKAPDGTNDALSSSGSTAGSRIHQGEENVQQQRTRRERRHHPAAELMIARQNRFVVHQALFYCLAFLNSVVPSSVTEVVRLTLWSSPEQQQVSSSNPIVRSLTAIVVAFFYLLVPLQGWINCIIYLRPRLWCWMQAHPERSFWWIAWQILIERQPLPRRATTRRTSALSASSMGSEDANGNAAGE